MRAGAAAKLVGLVFAGALAVGTADAGAQAAAAPRPVAGFPIASLAGEWFEVAASGSAWAHRRCQSGTRFRVTVTGPRRADVVRTCMTPTGVEMRRGRMAAPSEGSGALRGRFVSALFGWIPGAWTDYWVLAAEPHRRWLLVGDRGRERLAVWSRTVALDEAALAAAIAAGRAQGYDSRQLRPVPHPYGSGGPLCSAFRRSSSSRLRGQSSFSSRERPRSASSRPPVWQAGQ